MSSKNWLVLALAIVALASGMIDQYFFPGVLMPITGVAATLLSALLLFGWYRIDTNQHAYKRSPFLDVGIILIALIAFPIDLFRSRGAKRGAIGTAIFLLAMLVYGIIGSIGQYIIFALQS